MSVSQGGCGFPLLHNCVFDYLVSGKCTSIVVDECDMPEPHLMDVIQKVDVLIYNLSFVIFILSCKG